MLPTSTDLEALFRWAPGPVVIVAPDLAVIAANAAYLEAARAPRERLVGRSVLENLPGAGEPGAPDPGEVRRSLERVLATGEPDRMPIARYDGRSWSRVAYPVVADDGRIEAVIQRSEDVTELVELRGRDAALAADLAQANAQYQAMYDQGLFTGRLSVEGIVLDANRSSLEACGFTREDVIGKPFWDCGWWDRAPEVQAWVKAAVAQAARGEPFRGTSPYFTADGSERVVEFACMPIKDEDGGVRFLIPTGIDITGRARAETERRATRILESITDAFFSLGRDWRFTYVNRQAERILARARGDLIGRTLWDEYPGLAGSPFTSAYHRAMDRGEASTVTEYYPDHDRWYEVHASPAGEGISVYFRDVTERTRIDQELARLEAEAERLKRMYEAALSNTPDLAYVFDLDHRFLYANEALLRMWGRSREDALGKTCLELGYPDWHAAMHDREIDEVAATKRPIRGEVPFTGTNGRRIYDYIFVPVLDASGEVVAVAGTTRDVTERQQAEQALRTSEAELRKFKFISDNASVAFLMVEASGRIAYANKFACQERGYPEGGLEGTSISDLNPLYPPVRVEQLFARVRETKVATFEAIHRRLDGSTFPVEVLTTYLDLEGEPYLFSAIRDITERRDAQAGQERLLRQVEAERERLRDAFQRSPSFMATLRGPDHAFELANDRYYELVGRRDILGKPVAEAIPEARGQGFLSLLDQVYRTGEPFVGRDHRVRVLRRPGEAPVERVLDFVYEPLREPDGSVSGILAHGVDVTEHKLAEEALREADRKKDEFLAMLAHELRNPLSAIGNAAQVLRRSPAPEHLDWAKGVIDKHVKSLSRMIDDLLDVSRITRGKIELKRKPLDVRPILAHAVETVRPLVEERKHDLIVAQSSEPMWVDADPHRLEQVVVNLLNNAAKYTESGGRIDLGARPEGDSVVIRVKDNGAGIPPEKIPAMFELFTQGDRSIARSEGGLGIGLTLVKNLVEMHGGGISARSDGPGTGSEFAVSLPAIPAPEPGPATAAPDANGVSRRVARVLVVDDNEDTGRGLVRLLKLQGHEVTFRPDGPSAIDAAHADRPEFVLLDIGLPGMDGYAVAERLRADGHDAAVLIAISGYGEEAARRRSREAGFDHHLVKPIDFDELAGLLRPRS